MAARLLALTTGGAILAATVLAQPGGIPPRVQQLLDARDFAGAERAVADDLRQSPGWETGHLLLAQIYCRTARYDRAERSATAAIRIRESLDGFLLLATATMRLGRLNDSIGWLEKAARQRPDHPDVYKILGLNYALGGALKESEKAFARAAQLRPGDWDSHYYRGRALFELGRFREARASLLAAVERNGASVKAWTALGQVQERIDNAEAAEASYRKAVAACGAGRECAWPLLQLGFLYYMGDNPERAMLFFRQAREARPDWARPHFHLGKALAASGDLAGARAELEQTVKLDDSRSEYHYQLAQIYRQLGEGEKAAVQLERFRTLAHLERNARPAPEFAQP